MTPRRAAEEAPNLSLAVTQLMKGAVYRDTHEAAWRDILQLQAQVRDHFEVVGLVAEIDEDEGYAYLRSRPDDPDEESIIPRLVPRRQLSLHVSVLLALLRKKLAEFDAAGGDVRLVITRQQIIDMLTVFLPRSTADARLIDQIDAHIGKAIDLGFLRRVSDTNPSFEVRRILKAFVDGQWLADLDTRLAEYAALFADSAGKDGQ
jgi:Domain of unknown function (DUF4194)